MHVYIYDSFLNKKKYERVLANIETRITDLGLNGKISRLSITKNIKEVVSHELRNGAKTIVAVGNDKTINQVINSMADSNTPMGIIPVGEKNNLIAKNLGIELEENACETLSARRITKIDLGSVNNIYFLSHASIENRGTTIEISKNYSVEIMEEGRVDIVNLPPPTEENMPQNKFNPQDGILELFIKTRRSKNFFIKQDNKSVFLIKKIFINNIKNLPIILDGAIKVPPPAEITVIKQKLNIIVGKKRCF